MWTALKATDVRRALADCIRPILEREEFKSNSPGTSFTRTSRDYFCTLNSHVEVDPRANEGVIEIGVFAGHGSLCRAWLKLPGIENPNRLTHLGLGGQITELMPPEPMFYVFTSNTSWAQLSERITDRLVKLVVPFYREFADREHLVRVWAKGEHPFASIEGREIQLAASVLECFSDSATARSLVGRAISREQQGLKRAIRQIDRARHEDAIQQLNNILAMF